MTGDLSMLSIISAFKSDKPKRTANEENEVFFNTFSPHGTFQQNLRELEAAAKASQNTSSSNNSGPQAKPE